MSDFLPFVVVGLTAGSVYGLAGTGLVLTYKTSGIFNFAHGTIAALIAYAFYDLRERQGLPWPIALGICILVLAPLAGFGLERLVRRMADAPVVIKVVATVGLLVGIQQLIIIRYGPANIFVDPFLPTRTFSVVGVKVGIDQVIVMAIALTGMVALTYLFHATRLGRDMRAVVDRPDLLAMTGTSPIKVRRRAWYIGTAFAGLSGVLFAPTIGLESNALTLLVVQAFGAAAIGLFTSIPFTYVGGLTIGVLGSLATKYVASIPALDGVPPSLPFIVLFLVLLVAPERSLRDVTVERKPRVSETRAPPPNAVVIAGVAIALIAIWRLPDLVGTRLPVWSAGMAYILIFLSLALLMRTSGQVSLAQLAFASVGAVAAGRLNVEADVPWLLAIFIGALLTVPLGALLAIPAIRRSGLYLALATYGFAILLERLVFSTSWMFGAGVGVVPMPRPSFASGDEAYFYVVAAFALAAIGFVTLLLRTRLGRLLRAMSDSPTALATYGTSVTRLKVIVFCVSAFLAGLGGALLGPVTGRSSPQDFFSFQSLLMVVIFMVVIGGEVHRSIGASIGHVVFPVYISSWFGHTAHEYLPVLFAIGSVMVVPLRQTGAYAPAWLARAASKARRHPERSPIKSRVEQSLEPA